MYNFTERHRIKFLRLLEKELKEIEKPTILEFGVSGKALSTSIFLETCNQKMGGYFQLMLLIIVIILGQKLEVYPK